MLPGMELMDCPKLAVPLDVMHHVVRVESSFNPYAIGVVGGRLARQPANLPEALATVRMLEGRGFNFSLGLAQVNRYNLSRYGLTSYERAFQTCPNLQAGARILAECHGRAAGDWGKSFSCYYSGNFTTGFRHGYVQKIYSSMRRGSPATPVQSIAGAIPVYGAPTRKSPVAARYPLRATDRRDLTSTVPQATPPRVARTNPAQARVDAPLTLQSVETPVLLRPNGQPPKFADAAQAAPAQAPDAAAPSVVATPGDAAFVF